MLMIAIPLFLSLQSLCCYRREIRYPLAACFPARCPDFNSQVHFFFFFPALCSLSGWQLPYISTHLLWMKKADKPYFFSQFCQGCLTLEWRTRTSQLAFKDIRFHVSEDFCLFLVFGLCDGKQWFPMLNQSYICIPFAHVVNLYCVPNIREF